MNENLSVCNLYPKPTRKTQLLPSPLTSDEPIIFQSEISQPDPPQKANFKSNTRKEVEVVSNKQVTIEIDDTNALKRDKATEKQEINQGELTTTSETQNEEAKVTVPIIFLDVLAFPTQQVPLVIYEPRYRMMCKWAFEQRRPIGIFNDTTKHSLGSLVSFDASQLEENDTTLHITGTAFQRVELKDYWTCPATFGLTYAEVAYYNDIEPQTEEERDHIKTIYQHMRRLIGTAYTFLTQANRLDALRTVSNPKQLSFWIATHLSAPSKTQHEWFTLSSTAQRLEKQLSILQRYITQYKRSK